ncbi:probable protein phosphatase 2C 77 [Zingiber officinale]|uniref:probable protein phosphatase 2C 77 n=1 Tax=Zingiber officinale TaxID=94328 RepID=UPI001C4C3D78|nr:probable protein phosphatase 2C 77 [Zingiber officinale]
MQSADMVEPVEVQLCSDLVQLLHLPSDYCCCCCNYSPSKRPAAAAAVFEAGPRKIARRRPLRLLIPEPPPSAAAVVSGFANCDKEIVHNEFEVEGKGYTLAWRKGQNKHVMEDGYEVIGNINDDPTQAFFGVFDGHGGRAAVDFVSQNLGKNIVSALEEEENQPDLAIKAGYLTTDKDFITQGVKSGVCVATVLLKNGELHVANVGDCRVVLSHKGIAKALTADHRAGREDERERIENLGGYITCRNGVWRVQDSLAVSRAIGDANMKEWIISEPEVNKIRSTPECEFLIVASDGLWDKVGNQEAIDVVSKHFDSVKACKDLIKLSCSRGSKDDITVMVVNLQQFVQMRNVVS